MSHQIQNIKGVSMKIIGLILFVFGVLLMGVEADCGILLFVIGLIMII